MAILHSLDCGSESDLGSSASSDLSQLKIDLRGGIVLCFMQRTEIGDEF